VEEDNTKNVEANREKEVVPHDGENVALNKGRNILLDKGKKVMTNDENVEGEKKNGPVLSYKFSILSDWAQHELELRITMKRSGQVKEFGEIIFHLTIGQICICRDNLNISLCPFPC
jgi:hypothetical protein